MSTAPKNTGIFNQHTMALIVNEHGARECPVASARLPEGEITHVPKIGGKHF